MTAPERTEGELPSRRKPIFVGVLALAALVIGLGTWATYAMIDGAVVAAGRVIVESNRQAVQHPDGGVVAEVLVKEGARVSQGDVLVRLDPTLAQSELGMVENQLYEVIARRGRLAAERDGIPNWWQRARPIRRWPSLVPGKRRCSKPGATA